MIDHGPFKKEDLVLERDNAVRVRGQLVGYFYDGAFYPWNAHIAIFGTRFVQFFVPVDGPQWEWARERLLRKLNRR